MEKENQNPFSETNIQTTSKDHGNRNQGKTNNGTTKCTSRIASEGMDILGSIGNLAFQTFSMINDRNQRGKKGDKNQQKKMARLHLIFFFIRKPSKTITKYEISF
jgi:hypothetical protein